MSNNLIFSNAFITDASKGAIIQCLTGAVPQNSTGSIPLPFASGTESVTFYQGTIPSTSDQNVYTSANRSADALLQFSATGAFTASGTTIVANYGTSQFGTILKAGTISWFCFGNTDTNTNRPQLFGTVGSIGSSADLILPKVSVVLNDLWLCTNLWFNMNQVANYVPLS